MFPSLRIFTNAASKRVIPSSRHVKEILATEMPELTEEGILMAPKTPDLPLTGDQIVFLRSLLPLQLEDAWEKLRTSEHYEPLLHTFFHPPVETESLPRELLDFLTRPPPLNDLEELINLDIPLPPGCPRPQISSLPGGLDWDAIWEFAKRIDPHGERPEYAAEIARIQALDEEQDKILQSIEMPDLNEIPQLFDFKKLLVLQWDRWRAFSVEVFEFLDELEKFREALDQFMINLPNLTVQDIQDAYPEWGDEILPVLEQRQWAFDESAVVFHDDEASAIEEKARFEAVGEWMKKWDEADKQFYIDFFDGKDVKPPPISLWHIIEMTPSTPPHPRVDFIQAQFVSNDPHDHAHAHH